MTTYWVSSVNGNDSNDGSTKALAKASLQNGSNGMLDAGPLSPGDILMLDSAHSESWSTTTNLIFCNSAAAADAPLKVISINWSTEAYSKASAAQIIASSTGNVSLFNHVAFYGVFFKSQSSGDIRLGPPVNAMMILDDCTMEGESTYSYAWGGGFIVFRNGTTLQYTNAVYWISSMGGNTNVFMKDCVIDMPNLGTGDYLIVAVYPNVYLTFEDSDLSNANANAYQYLIDELQTHSRYVFRNCRFPSSLVAIVGAPDSFERNTECLIEKCYSGTDTVPNWIMEFYVANGVTKAVDSVYRTGGATDGETPIAWELNPHTTVHDNTPCYTPPICRWVNSGSQTLTLYLASSSSLNNDECWVEVSSPNESTPAYALGQFNTNKPGVLVSGSALTTDSGSTWNGSGVGTKMKIDVSITPTEAGIVTLRCFLAKDQTTYVDPVIYVA